MSKVKLATGKGCGEKMTGDSLSNIFSIPIEENAPYFANQKHYMDLPDIGFTDDDIASYRATTELVANKFFEIATDRNLIDSLSHVSFNADSAGKTGNRADIELRDQNDVALISASIKNNSVELSSARYSLCKTSSPITGLKYSPKAQTDIRDTITSGYSNGYLMLREHPEKFGAIMEKIADVEIGELERAVHYNKEAALECLTSSLFGNDPNLLTVVYKSAKGRHGQSFTILRNNFKITDIDVSRALIRAGNKDDVVSKTLLFDIRATDLETGTVIADEMEVRYKSGEKDTFKNGKPRNYVKTSVTLGNKSPIKAAQLCR